MDFKLCQSSETPLVTHDSQSKARTISDLERQRIHQCSERGFMPRSRPERSTEVFKAFLSGVSADKNSGVADDDENGQDIWSSGEDTSSDDDVPVEDVNHSDVPHKEHTRRKQNWTHKESYIKPSYIHESYGPINKSQNHGIVRSANSNKRKGLTRTERFLQVVNIAFSLLFLALGVFQIYMHGYSISTTSSWYLAEALKYAVTIWPIMFTATCTPAIIAFATYQAERRIKLANLQKLLHSTSFASTIIQPLREKEIGLITVMLFLTWGISPLMSQALQRMSQPASTTNSLDLTVNYTLPNVSNGDALNPNQQNLFTAALMSSATVQDSSFDAWSYPKVPMVEYLIPTDSSGDYYFYALNQTTPIWSSLLGIPHSFTQIAQLGDPRKMSSDSINQTDFELPASYFGFNCTPFRTVPADKVDTSLYYPKDSGHQGLLLYLSNSSEITDVPTLHLALGDEALAAGTSSSYIISECTGHLVTVELSIFCYTIVGNLPSCDSDSVRQYTDSNMTGRYSLTPGKFDTGLASALRSDDLPRNLMGALYLKQPQDILESSSQIVSNVTLSLLKLSTMNISVAVTNLVNTFYQAGGDASIYLIGLTDSELNVIGDEFYRIDFWYVSIPWAVIYMFCATVILIIAILEIIWVEKTQHDRDFHKFSASVIRSNKSLSRYKRIHKIKDVKAMHKLELRVRTVDTKNGTTTILEIYEPLGQSEM